MMQALPLPPTVPCALLEPTPARRVHADTLICASYHLGQTVGAELSRFSPFLKAQADWPGPSALNAQDISVIQAIAVLY